MAGDYMKVRVFDILRGVYFKSEVYAIINTGWYEKQLILVPAKNGAYFKFFDYLARNEGCEPTVLINTIVDKTPSEWVRQRSGAVDKQIADYNGILDRKILFFEYIGYPWIFENKSVMNDLLNGKAIPLKNSIFENKTYTSNIEGWNYIETKEDAEYLLGKASGFHDSVLKELNYVSGAYVDCNNNMLPTNNLRKISLCIG